MAETLFQLNRDNYQNCQQLFRGDRNQEYYCGDYWVDEAAVIDVCARRKTVGAMSVIRLKSLTTLYFRRSQKHIRDDSTDLSILWFVKKGQLVYSNQHGSRTAQRGEFVITRSMSPFYMENRPDADGTYEVLHVTVPTHIFRDHVPQDASCGLFLAADQAEVRTADSIFEDILADASGLTEASEQLLMLAALGIIGNGVRASGQLGHERKSAAERRLVDVLRYFEVHLSEPNLSTAMVARECGISPRYLSFLLKMAGTSFSDLVWTKRLEKAKNWLASGEQSGWSISEIAYGVGFKSPAHFSRMFKRVYGMNPRDFREQPARPETASPAKKLAASQREDPRNLARADHNITLQ